MATIIGKEKLVKTGRRYSWNKQSGFSSEVRYEGEKDAVRKLMSRFVGSVDDVNYETSGPTATLTARINRDNTGGGGGENEAEVTTTWELIGQDTQKDIRSHWRILTLHPNTIKDVEKAVEKVNDGTYANAAAAFAVNIHTGTTATGAWTNNAKFLYFMLSKGQENWLDFEYVLRKSELVASDYQRQMATYGVGYIWTTQQVASAEGMPGMIQATVSDIPAPTFTVDGDITGTGYTYKWRWLKKSPQVTQVAGGRFERNQEWQLNIWPNFIYPEAS
jgi:hypothetical protein